MGLPTILSQSRSQRRRYLNTFQVRRYDTTIFFFVFVRVVFTQARRCALARAHYTRCLPAFIHLDKYAIAIVVIVVSGQLCNSVIHGECAYAYLLA